MHRIAKERFWDVVLAVGVSLTLALGLGTCYGQSGDQLTDAVNAVRANYGLHALAYDQNLANWAAHNNAAQRSYGMGHHVMGAAVCQNAAWGQPDIRSVVAAWVGSGGHLANFLNPNINACGGHFDGTYWTWSGGFASVPVQAPTPQKPVIPPDPIKLPDPPGHTTTAKSSPPVPAKSTPQATQQCVPVTPSGFYDRPWKFSQNRLRACYTRRWRFFGFCR